MFSDFQRASNSHFKLVTRDERFLSIPAASATPSPTYIERLIEDFPDRRPIFNSILKQQQKLRFGTKNREWFDYYIWPTFEDIRASYADIVNDPYNGKLEKEQEAASRFLNFPVLENGRPSGPKSIDRSAKLVRNAVNESDALNQRLVMSVVGKVGSGKSCFSRFLFSCRRSYFLKSNIICSRIAFSEIDNEISSQGSLRYAYGRVVTCLTRDVALSYIVDQSFRKTIDALAFEDEAKAGALHELRAVAHDHARAFADASQDLVLCNKNLSFDIGNLSEPVKLEILSVVHSIGFRFLVSLDGFDLINCIDFYQPSKQKELFDIIAAIIYRRSGIVRSASGSAALNTLNGIQLHFVLFLRDTTSAYFAQFNQSGFDQINPRLQLLAPPSFNFLAGGVLDRFLKSTKAFNKDERRGFQKNFQRYSDELSTELEFGESASILSTFNFNARKAKRFFGILLCVALEERLRAFGGEGLNTKNLIKQAFSDRTWKSIIRRPYKIW
ncbi:hypothetical protein QTO30_10250 [Yoonia sp. GPGPB17]|uniref:hypothetical protein n=1 Tax=Yoonia sp. GPGPB17 TaxID=3026147 RepID=UPI0030BAC587